MKETLEEMVTRIKAENKRLNARLEESEYKHALVCEAVEGFLDTGHLTTIREWQQLCQAARKALNGISDDN
jgi:hypothetical protein